MPSETADLRVVNAKVVTPGGTLFGGVAANDGKIVDIGAVESLPDADEEIDAEENYLIPGFVDPHVHMGLDTQSNDYHSEYEIDFETETRGALHGGTTTMLNFLLQREPYLPDMDFFKDTGEDNAYIDFGFHAIVHQEHHIDEIEDLAEEGVRSFKLFFNMYKNSAPELGIDHSDVGDVYRVLSKTADMGHGLVMFHAENDDLGTIRRKELREEGRDGLEAWADASPRISEAMQIEHIGKLTDYTDGRAYVVHNSAAETVDVIKRYQEKGVSLYGETLSSFLGHNYDEDMGAWGKISPPIRGPESQDRLWEGVRSGVLNHLGTDHCPFRLENKGPREQNIWDTTPGDQPGMEYSLPVIMSEGVNKNRITMERAVEIGSTNNAKLFGLYPRKGSIVEGADADMVIVDLEKSAVVDEDFYHTKETRWSSFHGRELTGLPTHTIKGGEIAVRDGELVIEKGVGEYLPRYDNGVPQE